MQSLTNRVKDELVAVTVQSNSARMAELAAMIRYGGVMGMVDGIFKVVIEFNHLGASRRIMKELSELLQIDSQLYSVQPYNTDPRYHVVVEEGAAELIRRVGLITRGGHPVVGLPPRVINGTVTDTEAAWRGAFLATGFLQDPARASLLEVEAPSIEAALALVGCARRCGLVARTKETRMGIRTAIRDGDAVGAMLTRMGAHMTRLEWDKERLQREATTSTNRLANFDDANLRRSAQAAIAAAARAERALEILGDSVPEHLAEAGHLRVRHVQASLEELGKLAEPPMTKDAIAGRIRRLLSMADKVATEQGVPDTKSALKTEA